MLKIDIANRADFRYVQGVDSNESRESV